MRSLKLFVVSIVLMLSASATNHTNGYQHSQTITPRALKDKIAGGWAGKMIGVTYGAPSEFHAQGKTFDDSIHWKPSDVIGSLTQDDIYVQLTFMMTMDKYGINSSQKKYQEMFAKAGYLLWHANVQARKNYYDSIFPPLSGRPDFNAHADDIDFQIEADYLGLMCPGMPVTSSKMADKIGHIMNYGDGVYGGIFISALYTQAFFANDLPVIIDNARKTLPAESDYAKIISDVVSLHKNYPNNWKTAWRELQNKWGYDHFCGSGYDFNIDAKFNGAFIVMGLLYGNGDPMKTIEITTRCGQDSDCNPSSAMGILGVIIGFDKLPAEMKAAVTQISDSIFINTDYSFNKAVERTYTYALQLIAENGGKLTDQSINISSQIPTPMKLEVAFPDVVTDKKIVVFDNGAWTFKGNWKDLSKKELNKNKAVGQSKYSGKAGDLMEIGFIGTGISIDGNWVRDGGKADIYLDDKFMRTIDSYFFYNEQEHENITLWHITGLPNSSHKLKLIVKEEKRPESVGTNIYLTQAIIYKTAKKKSQSYKFPFEK